MSLLFYHNIIHFPLKVSSYIPLQAIIRIDEVDKEGASKVSDTKPGEGNIAAFPFPGSPKPGQPVSEE